MSSERRIIEIALALAEKAFRDHAETCYYYNELDPEACPICRRLIRARDEARRRARAAMDTADGGAVHA